MDLYFADWSLVSRPDRLKAVGSDAISTPRVPDGTPVLVDNSMRPVEPWCTFLGCTRKIYVGTLLSPTPATRSNSAASRDERRWGARCLGESDLVAYRADRF